MLCAMNDPNRDAALVDLQSRMAYQEDTLEKLDAVVAEQEQRIERLSAMVERLSRRLGAALDAPAGGDGGS